MSTLKQSLRLIPYWAYLLMLLVIIVNSLYLYYKNQFPEDGLIPKFENGHWLAADFKPGSVAYSAGLRSGDRIISANSIPANEWMNVYFGQQAGDTIIFKIFRNNKVIWIPVILSSYFSNTSGFFWSVYIVMLLFPRPV